MIRKVKSILVSKARWKLSRRRLRLTMATDRIWSKWISMPLLYDHIRSNVNNCSQRSFTTTAYDLSIILALPGAIRSIFYACVVKGDFFSTSIPCASLVGTQWIFICFFALNFSYFFPEIGRHLFLLFYCYVTSAQRFILQRSRTRSVKIWW